MIPATTVEAVRIALGSDEAKATLTPHQLLVLTLWSKDPNASAIARALGVSRQAVMKSISLGIAKLAEFAEAISHLDGFRLPNAR